MKRVRLSVLLVSVLMLCLAPSAAAKSGYLANFITTYPPADNTRIDNCLMCHVNASPNSNSARNSYGTAWRNAGKNFQAIEGVDSDGDGFSNLDEINALAYPGNASDKPAGTVAVPNLAGLAESAAQTAVSDAGLTVGTIGSQFSATVAAGAVISQNPAAGALASPGAAVNIVVSLGPDPAAGIRAVLAAGFDAADANGDGRLSFAEASAAAAGVDNAAFGAIDTNGDGFLDRAELGVPEGDAGGCNCAKSLLTPADFQKRLGDLFLTGLALSLLAAWGSRRR